MQKQQVWEKSALTNYILNATQKFTNVNRKNDLELKTHYCRKHCITVLCSKMSQKKIIIRNVSIPNLNALVTSNFHTANYIRETEQ